MTAKWTYQLRKNWFKIFFIGLLLYIFFQKDLSFQINMRAPAPPENIVAPATPGDRMTDAAPGQVQSATFNPVRLPLFGNPAEQSNLRSALATVSEDDQMAYLRRFARVAISERKKYNIPSSIILASALLHSTAGTSELATSANNHFHFAIGSGWDGLHFQHEGTEFRMYENAWSSFRDHSEYLAHLNLGELRRPAATDYQSWAELLEAISYSREPQFATTILEIIQAYQLYELDQK
jgi:hypothetical protein